jgi:hypothetical protein
MGEPNTLVPLALAAFLPAVAACFALLDARRAVLAAMLGGWLFLPVFDGNLDFLGMRSKMAFVSAAVLLGSITFDPARWRQFRPRLLDLPVAVLCAGPFATALANDLGLNEAASATFATTMTWGVPYLLGRVYLGRPPALRGFASALVVATLAYVPFTLWEVRMSPQLHYEVYGLRLVEFWGAVRYGGYRPIVFMQHHLALAQLMAVGTLTAYWLWRTGALQRVAGVALSWVWPVLGITTLLCKSVGAIVLVAAGIASLEAARRFRASVLLLALALLPPVFCAARLSGWSAETVVAISRGLLDEERAHSLQFRIENENALLGKAMMRPWLGWGRTGRSFVYDEETGRQLSVVDSLWIITLGFSGLVGLIALGTALLVPPLALLRSYAARYWADPRLASAAVLAVALLLWAVDDLVNAMLAPTFPAMAGALVSFVLSVRAGDARQTARSSRRSGRGAVTSRAGPGLAH